MNTGGLSLDQAPPIAVPWRFFLTAPVFGLAAAAVLAAEGPGVLASRWVPATAGVVHLLTLGFATMVMAGAMLQMLPVVAGAPVAFPRLVAWGVHLPLTAGTASLAAGFLTGDVRGFSVGAVLLAIFACAFAAAVGASLARAKSALATVNGMWAALAAFAVTATLGVLLAWSFGSLSFPASFATWRDAHPVWGLAGWVGLLVVGVGYQVVPMFQLTKPYPPLMTRFLAPVALGAMAAASLLPGTWAPRIAGWAAALALGAFGVATLVLQARRRRRLPDVSLDYWRVAMVSLVAVSLLHALRFAWPPALAAPLEIALGVLALFGFALSVIEGMLLKIVPFLAWFHLQAEAGIAKRVPHMKELLPDAHARFQWQAHAASVVLFVGAIGWAPLFWPAAAAFGASQAALAWNLLATTARLRDARAALRAR